MRRQRYERPHLENGALLGTLAAAHRARRIVEVGGGLGYGALWFAYGAGPGSLIESVERDHIIRVTEKVNVTDAEVESGKDQMRDELVNARRDKFFAAYMQKAKQGLNIAIREDVLARVTGTATGT